MIGVRALLVLGILQSLGGQVLVNEKVRAWIGSSVVLNCNIKILEGVVTQVTWKRNEKGQNVDFLTYSGGKVQKLTKFAESRVEFLGNQPTEGSIMIRDVTLADESVYTCIFTTFPSGAYSNMSSLIVQAEPDIHVEPLPNPVVAKLPFQTVGTCVAGAAKPAANISWWTDGLDYLSSEQEIKHDNGTVTIQSHLQMIPEPQINNLNVTCIISQNNGTSYTRIERSLTIRNIQYPPDSVRVEVRTLDNGGFHLICVEESSPPATNFTWKRKDAMNSDVTVELAYGKTLFMENFPNGLYICEVTNSIGPSSGYLYLHQAGSSCLHAWLWLFLILVMVILVLGLGYFWYRKHWSDMKAQTRETADRKGEDKFPT
ncbi:nectin-1-like isoform X2 [Pyxicephalus adspersus]|uniref:nectin-1-like isoform X2 n=1 Tax=Pyxicephalus adspersus TaxID=30357 RepID=UPI003B58CE99